MSEKKKPVVRFAGFTNDWEQRKLGELVEENQIPILTPKESYIRLGIRSHAKGTFHEKVLAGKGLDVDTMYVVEADNLIVNITFAWEHAIAVTTEKDAEKLVSHRFPQYKMRDVICSRFLQHDIKDEEFRKKLSLASQGGAGRNRVLNKTQFLEIERIVPPEYEEQKKIGLYFDTLDYLITLHQRKCDKLKNVKKSMLEKMFPKNGCRVPEIRFAGFTDDWEQRKLGDVGYTYTGLSGKTKNDFGHGKAKFVTYMNVFSNPVTNIEMLEDVEIDNGQNEVQAGDVFFTTSSETPDEVGMSSVMLENKPNIYLNSFCFGYRPTEKIDNYYFAYMLRSGSVRKSITFLAQGISRYNISKNKVMEIEIPLPKTDEQQAIGAYFKHLDNLITLHQRKLEKLQNIKKSCLEKMFV